MQLQGKSPASSFLETKVTKFHSIFISRIEHEELINNDHGNNRMNKWAYEPNFIDPPWNCGEITAKIDPDNSYTPLALLILSMS